MPKESEANWLAYVGLICASAIYGGWALVAKLAMTGDTAPFIFAFYRCMGGTVILSFALLLMPDLMPRGTSVSWCHRFMSQTPNEFTRFALLGVLMAGNICGFILGASRVSAITCSLLQTMIPMVTATLSAIFRIEDFSPLKCVSIICSVAGAVVVIVLGEHKNTIVDTGYVGPGVACLVLNVTCSAMYFVLQKGFLLTHSAVFVTAMTYAWSTCFIFFVALGTSGMSWVAWSMEGNSTTWLCTAYAVCLTTALNYSIMAWANQRTSPATVTCSATMQPVSAALLSWAIMGTRITQAQVGGGIMIALGLLVYVRAKSVETCVEQVVETCVEQVAESKSKV